MARILFIQPPYNSIVESTLEVKAPPLGMAYLAAMLEDEHKVRILDCPTIGYSEEHLEKFLKKYKPDIVGISCSSTPSIYRAEKVAKVVKEVDPSCKVIMGGTHVTFVDEETLRECAECDFIVRGEGEYTTKELVKAIEEDNDYESVHGITYRDNNIIKRTEDRALADLDKIPFPARHLLPMEKYKFGKYQFGTIMGSRGCPFNCIFCSSSRLFGRRWRGRSPENILEEIKELYDDYNIRYIEFLDDTFTLNKKRAIEIGNLIKKENFDIQFDCSSRVDTLNENVVKALKRGGLQRMYVGVESGSQRILNILGKGITLQQIKDAVKMLKKYNVEIVTSAIIGSPYETEETIKETISFIKNLNPDYAQFTIFTPYPGTPVYKFVEENGLLLTKDWSRYTCTEPVMKIPGSNLKPEDVKKWFKRAYLSIYASPSYLLGQLRKRNIPFFKRVVELVSNSLIDVIRSGFS